MVSGCENMPTQSSYTQYIELPPFDQGCIYSVCALRNPQVGQGFKNIIVRTKLIASEKKAMGDD